MDESSITDEEIKALASLIDGKSKYLITHLISMTKRTIERSALLHGLLPRCQKCAAKPSTVKHRYADVMACDRCCAEMIVNMTKTFIMRSGGGDALTVVRCAIINESNWDDVEMAPTIRKLTDYVRTALENERSNSVRWAH